jgi:hypothetical protein
MARAMQDRLAIFDSWRSSVAQGFSPANGTYSLVFAGRGITSRLEREPHQSLLPRTSSTTRAIASIALPANP